MNGLKRLCSVVFVLADAFVVTVLALTWFGPWTKETSALFILEPFVIALMVCMAVSALGLLVILGRALFARRTVRTVEIATVDGGVISVTRDAIAAQASHIVEADGTCTAARVRVDAKQRGHIRVHVRVLPHETVDVVLKGAELHEELIDGLAAVCGDKVEDVSLEFIEPESVKVTSSDDDEVEAGSAAAGAGAPSSDSTSEITVSMGTAAREVEREA